MHILHDDTSSVPSPCVIGCFISQNRHQGKPDHAWSSLGLCLCGILLTLHFTPQSRLGSFSATSTLLLMALLLCVWWCPGFYLAEGMTQILDLHFHAPSPPPVSAEQSSTSSWYFALFLSCTSSQLSFQGTVSSSQMSCLVASDTEIVWSKQELDKNKNFSCLFCSTVITQSFAMESNTIEQFLGLFFSFSPSLTHMVILAIVWICLLSLTLC